MAGSDREGNAGSREPRNDPFNKVSLDPDHPDDKASDGGIPCHGSAGSSGSEVTDTEASCNEALVSEAEKDDDGASKEALPSNRYLVLASRPCQDVEVAEGFAVERDERSGRVTLIHPKRFGRLEKGVHRWLGGPRTLRRPLDIYGSRLWDLCDGERSLAQIREVMESEFHEAIHPAASRIQRLLELMVRLGFVKLLPPDPETLERLSSSGQDQDEQVNGSSDVSRSPMEDNIKSSDEEHINHEAQTHLQELDG